jgi:hypothetical protein
MKRALIASILGLVVSAVSSYGQADYYFDTYGPVTGPGLIANPGRGELFWNASPSLAPAGEAGAMVLATDNVVANLLWSVTSGGLAGQGSGTANLTPVPVGLSGFGDIEYAMGGGEVIFDLPYTSNAGLVPIQFTLQFFQGASYATSTYKGSVSWTDPGIVTGAGPAYFDSAAFPIAPFVIGGAVVPEPTTMALLGLGAAGLLIIRKRQ